MQLSIDERPRQIGDIIGQKFIVKEFKNLSKTMNFPKVMTFEGATGSGKTTSALLIAQLLNCKTPIKNELGEQEPCCECDSCKNIMSGKLSRDVSLIACSGMGKDDLIEWSNKLYTAPMNDKYKIFILDEAQELSNPKTQGPLLSILEKEYKNTFIILTTMSVDKLHKAIISRSVPYKFKPITRDDIYAHLFKLLNKIDPDEKIPLTFIEQGMSIIADKSNGSAREALSYFQRAIQGELWTKEDIIEGLGFIDDETASTLTIKLLKKDWSFFGDLLKKRIDLDDFFNLAWSTLQLAVQLRSGAEVADDSPRSMYIKKYSQFATVADLERVFYNTKVDASYFEPKFFMHHVLEYMNDGRPNTQANVNEVEVHYKGTNIPPSFPEGSGTTIKRRPVS